jgi:hypothetical protein
MADSEYLQAYRPSKQGQTGISSLSALVAFPEFWDVSMQQVI